MNRTLITLLFICSLALSGLTARSTFAQDTACIGAVVYTAQYQAAHQALNKRVSSHADVYSKEVSALTAADTAIIRKDFSLYLADLVKIEAPPSAHEAWASEIALWAALLAVLDRIDASLPTEDYSMAGSILAGAMQQAKTVAMTLCTSYEAIYGSGQPAIAPTGDAG